MGLALKLRLLKLFDCLFGYAIVRLLPKKVVGPVPTRTASILLIRPGGIGDAALLIPVLRKLKENFSGVTLDILAEKRNSGVFPLCPGIRSVYRYDIPSELIAVLRTQYDVVIDAEQWHRLSAVVARLSRAPITIGFATNERRRLFTNTVDYGQDDYEVDNFLRLVRPLGIIEDRDSCSDFIEIPAEQERVARSLLGKAKGQFVAIFPGASIPERRWGGERFAELSALITSHGYGVVVIGGPTDVADGELITHGGGTSLAGKTSLPETAAIIARSSLLVSGDSGILHIAVGLGIPTVSLFGPGRAKKWAPRGENHIVLNKELPCSPCTTFGYTPKCPINARCMAEITVDEVEQAVLTLLEKNRSRQQKP